MAYARLWGVSTTESYLSISREEAVSLQSHTKMRFSLASRSPGRDGMGIDGRGKQQLARVAMTGVKIVTGSGASLCQVLAGVVSVGLSWGRDVAKRLHIGIHEARGSVGSGNLVQFGRATNGRGFPLMLARSGPRRWCRQLARCGWDDGSLGKHTS